MREQAPGHVKSPSPSMHAVTIHPHGRRCKGAKQFSFESLWLFLHHLLGSFSIISAPTFGCQIFTVVKTCHYYPKKILSVEK